MSQQREGPGWDLLHFMHAQHPFFSPNSADQEFARAALSPSQQDGAQKSFPQESLGSSTFPPSVGLFCSHIPIKALHSIILSRSQLWLYAGTALFGLFFFFFLDICKAFKNMKSFLLVLWRMYQLFLISPNRFCGIQIEQK